jgi:predicted component of type VI protein secretion system
MAYLVFSSHKGEEIGRRRLDGPVTIGRAADCEVSLHDILLSRHHCRVESGADGWVLIDLGSKNGTAVNNRAVTRHPLSDGETFAIGRVRVRFRAEALAPGEGMTLPPGRPKRPADPFDALAGTVAGFKYVPPADDHLRSLEQFPSPKPAPYDSGEYVGVTDSGRFVGVTDDVWIEDKEHDGNGDASAIGTVPTRSARAEVATAAAAVGVVRRDLVRPKAPAGSDAATPPALLPGPPPRPQGLTIRMRLAPFLHGLRRKLKKPFSRLAAFLIALAP